MGSDALEDLTTGDGNSAFGRLAGYNISTGEFNTCLGRRAGDNITTGSRNLCVGNDAEAPASDATDSINIGYQITGQGSNHFTFGKSGNIVYNQFTSNASWTRSSDVRLKKDIQTNTDLGLAFINDLRTVTYKWKAPSDLDPNFSGYDASKTEADYANKMYGFIAQEVKQALDDHNVTDFNGWSEDREGLQGISYEMFVMPLVKAVQELSAENAALKARLDAAGI